MLAVLSWPRPSAGWGSEAEVLWRSGEVLFGLWCFPSQAVAHILPFRDQNRQFLDPIWNQHHVERVEIVLKETVDAKGW